MNFNLLHEALRNDYLGDNVRNLLEDAINFSFTITGNDNHQTDFSSLRGFIEFNLQNPTYNIDTISRYIVLLTKFQNELTNLLHENPFGEQTTNIIILIYKYIDKSIIQFQRLYEQIAGNYQYEGELFNIEFEASEFRRYIEKELKNLING